MRRTSALMILRPRGLPVPGTAAGTLSRTPISALSSAFARRSDAFSSSASSRAPEEEEGGDGDATKVSTSGASAATGAPTDVHGETPAAEAKMPPYAYKQEAAWRKDPIQPFIDSRTRDPLYNPVVDDWVDFNNPRWKALQHTFHRPGPFFIGRCVATKTAKTAMIEVPYWIRSMKYGKHMAVRRTTRFMSHDEDQICEPGDIVEIRQSKKWSKRKHTVVTRILKKEPGNAFLKEHPEFAIVRSRADLRKRIEQLREEELAAAGLEVAGQNATTTSSTPSSQ